MGSCMDMGLQCIHVCIMQRRFFSRQGIGGLWMVGGTDQGKRLCEVVVRGLCLGERMMGGGVDVWMCVMVMWDFGGRVG